MKKNYATTECSEVFFLLLRERLPVSDVSSRSLCNPFSIYKDYNVVFKCISGNQWKDVQALKHTVITPRGVPMDPFFVYLNTAPSERYLQLSI